MQAAVVSVLLMAGACGDSGEPLSPAPSIVSAAPSMTQPPKTSAAFTIEQADAVPAGIPSATFDRTVAALILMLGLAGTSTIRWSDSSTIPRMIRATTPNHSTTARSSTIYATVRLERTWWPTADASSDLLLPISLSCSQLDIHDNS